MDGDRDFNEAERLREVILKKDVLLWRLYWEKPQRGMAMGNRR